MEMIKIENLYKTYGENENRVTALRDVTLSIEKGEFVAIVGASGSGKSTLLHVIGGIDKPSSGKVIVDEDEICKLSDKHISIFRRRKIGFVFQFFNLIPILTVEENIEMPVLIDDGIMDESYKKELLKLLGLEEKRNYLPSELSGGQQQRVAIGRALANKPSIILADEPTGNLDSRTAIDIIELLKFSARKYNQTLIVITHDDKVAKMADRVINIKDGEILNNEVF